VFLDQASDFLAESHTRLVAEVGRDRSNESPFSFFALLPPDIRSVQDFQSWEESDQGTSIIVHIPTESVCCGCIGGC
jgi:hypothetical protein